MADYPPGEVFIFILVFILYIHTITKKPFVQGLDLPIFFIKNNL
jgi:hypothetical protein